MCSDGSIRESCETDNSVPPSPELGELPFFQLAFVFIVILVVAFTLHARFFPNGFVGKNFSRYFGGSSSKNKHDGETEFSERPSYGIVDSSENRDDFFDDDFDKGRSVTPEQEKFAGAIKNALASKKVEPVITSLLANSEDSALILLKSTLIKLGLPEYGLFAA